VYAFHRRSTLAAKSATTVMVSAAGSLVTEVMGMGVPFLRSGRCAGSGVGGQQRVKPVDACSPYLFIAVQQSLDPLDCLGISTDDAFAAVALLGHQICPFQHGKVLVN